ncbi:uncharacterized protein LOC113291879 [Papaver somniferum]|uniref:uncharacterized protein LOC113291879 n=1 Tax=Papaver somniferum TaxID=3469 RepID=UPI000E6F72CC|nr:uncharacterized protein LOC113291879 [Papaver somniferum]
MSILMEKLVAPQQADYIKGRCIQEQVLLASEMVNEMKKKRRGDDVFMFCNGGKKCLQNVQQLLDPYQKSSGQIIDKSKSKLFIDGTIVLRKNLIQDIMQMERSDFPDKYLGVILAAGRVKTSNVWPMVEMLQGKLAAWKGRMMSFQEISVLIKVCTPFEEGGLAIPRLVVINRALLMKMMWKIMHSNEEWAVFFKAKYVDKNGQWSHKWQLSTVWPGLKWA